MAIEVLLRSTTPRLGLAYSNLLRAMAEQTTTNRARLESETYTKLHEVMKQKSGGTPIDLLQPKRLLRRAVAIATPSIVLQEWFCDA